MIQKGVNENENKNENENGGRRRRSIELDKLRVEKQRMKASRFSQHAVQHIKVQEEEKKKEEEEKKKKEEEEEKVRAYKYEDSNVIKLLHIMTLCVVWCGVVWCGVMYSV